MKLKQKQKLQQTQIPNMKQKLELEQQLKETIHETEISVSINRFESQILRVKIV